MNYYESFDSLTNEVIAIVAKRDDVFLFIPIQPANTDYRNYLEWIEAGNTASAWNPSEHNIPVVTPDGDNA
jgi:hypothetical protein